MELAANNSTKIVCFNPLSVILKKWSNSLKQFIGSCPFFRSVPLLFPLQTTKKLSEILSLIVTNSQESNIVRDLMST